MNKIVEFINNLLVKWANHECKTKHYLKWSRPISGYRTCTICGRKYKSIIA